MRRYLIHASRTCANCAHLDTDGLCLHLVGMANGSERPADFGCHEHQTAGEFRLDVHRPHVAPLEGIAS